jgi:hypothetical protein
MIVMDEFERLPSSCEIVQRPFESTEYLRRKSHKRRTGIVRKWVIPSSSDSQKVFASPRANWSSVRNCPTTQSRVGPQSVRLVRISRFSVTDVQSLVPYNPSGQMGLVGDRTT